MTRKQHIVSVGLHSIKSMSVVKDIIKGWWRVFLQGLIVIAPVGLTVFIVVWVVSTVDSYVREMLPGRFYFPGIGILSAIIIITLVGLLSRMFLFHALLFMADRLLEKIPGVNFVYVTLKELITVINRKEESVGMPVLVKMDEKGEVWKPGFLIKEKADLYENNDLSLVYLPHSYNFSGNIFLVNSSRVHRVHSVKSADFLKYIVSAGLLDIKELEVKKKEQGALAWIDTKGEQIEIIEVFGGEEVYEKLKGFSFKKLKLVIRKEGKGEGS